MLKLARPSSSTRVSILLDIELIAYAQCTHQVCTGCGHQPMPGQNTGPASNIAIRDFSSSNDMKTV